MYIALGNSFGVPLYSRFNEQPPISSIGSDESKDVFYVDADDIVLQQTPGRLNSHKNPNSNENS